MVGFRGQVNEKRVFLHEAEIRAFYLKAIWEDSKKNPLNREPIFAVQSQTIEFGLCSEYSMGGIVIDEAMATRVAGLFAAGEAGSGVFGACRVADATTEMMVQGSKAGRCL